MKRQKSLRRWLDYAVCLVFGIVIIDYFIAMWEPIAPWARLAKMAIPSLLIMLSVTVVVQTLAYIYWRHRSAARSHGDKQGGYEVRRPYR